MPYQVYARKLRPKSFDLVIGQDSIKKVLQNSLISGRIGHAFLFSGTRGVGKTTLARIFAKSLNCQERAEDGSPCLECENCELFEKGQYLDFYEIDGASHNGVDHIRQLIEDVHYLPSMGNTKIYLIDEVHMLSKEAFNALLKTLEDPPRHVVFLFATTLVDKVLDTIRSRCQCFALSELTAEQLSTYLAGVCKTEGIRVENDRALSLLAEEAKGSVRDMLSLFDRVLSYEMNSQELTLKAVTKALGLLQGQVLKELLHALLTGDLELLSRFYRGSLREGVILKNLFSQLSEALYWCIQFYDRPAPLVEKGLIKENSFESVKKVDLFFLYEGLNKDADWVLKSPHAEQVFEILLQKLTLRGELFGGKRHVESCREEEKSEMPEQKEELISLPVEESSPVVVERAPAERAIGFSSEELLYKEDSKGRSWSSFLFFLHQESPSLATNLEQGNIRREIEINGESEIHVDFAFPESGRIFYEYLKGEETLSRLRHYLGVFFEKDSSSVNFTYTLLEKEGHSGFLPVCTIRLREREQRGREEKENFLSNELIQQAKELFQAKVEKVVVKENF